MLLSIHVGVTDGSPPPIKIGTVAKARPMKMPSRTTRRVAMVAAAIASAGYPEL